VPSYTDSIVTGTWTPDRSITDRARAMVHLPDHQANTDQAIYHIDLGDGTVLDKTISQDTGGKNEWLSLARPGAAPSALARLTPASSRPVPLRDTRRYCN
jgi:hypothetical protein